MSGKATASDKTGQAIDQLLARLRDLETTTDEPFPPSLDDVMGADLTLTRWRAQAPPKHVEAVRRCYGEAHATLLFAQSDAMTEGQPLAEADRRRTFLRSFLNRVHRLKPTS